jgi:hypothetical protein
MGIKGVVGSEQELVIDIVSHRVHVRMFYKLNCLLSSRTIQ